MPGISGLDVLDVVRDKYADIRRTIQLNDECEARTKELEQQNALDAAEKSGDKFTDEASAVEKIGESVHLISTPFPNIKITVSEDISIASLLLGIQ